MHRTSGHFEGRQVYIFFSSMRGMTWLTARKGGSGVSIAFLQMPSNPCGEKNARPTGVQADGNFRSGTNAMPTLMLKKASTSDGLFRLRTVIDSRE